MARRPVVITKDQFKQILAPCVYTEFAKPEYAFDWKPDGRGDWEKQDAEIKEHCYKIPLGNGMCLKIYSTIDKETGRSRDIGEDSIKIVAARENTLKPVRPKFTHTYRLDTWRANFHRHISEALTSLGNNVKCDCGAEMKLKRNSREENFLGCTQYNRNPTKPCKGRTLKTNV